MTTLCGAWISGSIFALVTIIIRLLTKRKLPPFFFYWLWNIVLAMFFIPLRIPSSFSIYNLLPDFQAVEKSVFAKLGANQTLVQSMESSGITPYGGTEQSDWLLIIWIIGMIIFVLFFFANWMYWKLKLRNPKPFIFRSEREDKTYRFMLSDYVDSPCVLGLLKPKIFFPASWSFNDSLSTELSIKHEKAHILHLDNVRKTALCLLLCIQWFNPIVWFVYILANRDMELYCDACTIANARSDLRQSYARLLVYHRSQLSPISAPVRLLVNHKATLNERIILIMARKKSSTALLVTAVFCLVVLFSAFATASVHIIHEQDKGIPIVLPPGGHLESSVSEPMLREYSGSGVDLKNGDVLLTDGDFQDGQTVQLTLSIEPVKGYDKGQPVQYGYVNEAGELIPLGEAKLKDGDTLNFPVPDSSAEKLYIKNYCTDTIHSLSVNTAD